MPVNVLEKKKSNAPSDTPLLILVYKTLGHPLVCREGRRSERPAGRTRPRWGRYHTGSGATPPLGSSGEGRGSSSSSEPACSWLSGWSPLPCGLCPVGERNWVTWTCYHLPCIRNIEIGNTSYCGVIKVHGDQCLWIPWLPITNKFISPKNLLQRCVFDILK